MCPALPLLTSCLLVVAIGGTAYGEMRIWTDRTGKYTVHAEFLRGDAKKVRLQLENGKKLTVRTSQLSEQDQQFVRDQFVSTKSSKTAPGDAATASHKSSDVMQPGKEEIGSTKEEFAVFDIKLGMTDREVAQVLQRKGIRPSDVIYDSATGVGTVKISESDRQAYPRIYTDVEIRFSRELSARSGVAVCTFVKYSKDFPDHNGVDLTPIWSKLSADLIQRFGPPSEERHNEILFGDEKTRYLKAAYPCWIQLEDKELAKRLRDTYEQKERDEAQRKAFAEGEAVAETLEFNY